MVRVGAMIMYRDLSGDSRIALALSCSEDGIDVITTQGLDFCTHEEVIKCVRFSEETKSLAKDIRGVVFGSARLVV